MGAETFICDLVARAAGGTPDSPAIAGVDGRRLSYRSLLAQIERTADELNAMGIGRGVRVASVLPDGPVAAVAFLAVSSAAIYMPLDPAYHPAELAYRLERARIGAVLVPEGTDVAVRSTARRLSIPVVEIVCAPEPGAGAFSLEGAGDAPASGPGINEPGDLALLAYTSGTTSHPKLVPLTHANLCAGAENVRSWFRLGPDDRCLNVMPLYHMHAQLRGLLAPIAAGACVVCAPGPDMGEFRKWVTAAGVTYYSASPTVHRQVLKLAESWSDCPIRIVGSSSAPLDPELKKSLGQALGAAVVDSYGLTETSTQVVASPLPPAPAKTGSVGVAAGAQVAIADAAGHRLRPGERGEVIARGPGVIAAYEDAADNEEAFFGEWLRTGDEGYLDEDGFLFLTGRIKEIINRGGQKVLPAEVEQALLAHPAVEEAGAFALPDERLGESVAAAVVLKEDGAAREEDLIRFAAGRLADFKVPTHVFPCADLPRTGSGKVRRAELSERFAPATRQPQVHKWIDEVTNPFDPVEVILARMWEELLGGDLDIDRASSFFELGGDSMRAARLLARVETTFGVEFPAAIFYREPTIGGMAWYLAERSTDWGQETIVGLQTGGSRRPVFFCTAGPAWFLMSLARHLGPDQPFYALQAHELVDIAQPELDISELAAAYVRCIRRTQPEGPYRVAGLSAGGTVALEVAHQLRDQGQPVGLLAVMDAMTRPTLVAPFGAIARLLERQRKRLRDFRGLVPAEKVAAVRRGAEWLWDTPRRRASRRESEGPVARYVRNIHRAIVPLVHAHRRATARYKLRPYPGKIVYFWCEDTWFLSRSDPRLGWRDLALEGFVLHKVPGYHYEVLEEPHVRVLARKLRPYLQGDGDRV
jgi:acyl-CoA synthetase (AMP-forming)/AMP-acid ligase II/thioesterase domain-containing protein/acyl carrier protein